MRRKIDPFSRTSNGSRSLVYGQEIVGSFTSPRVASVQAATERQMAAVILEGPTERREKRER